MFNVVLNVLMILVLDFVYIELCCHKFELIINCFVGLKLISVDRSFAEKHYADLSAKPFFSGLVDYIISGPVVAMVWEGKNVVTTGRKIIGATNPAESAPGTIRGDYAIDIGRYVPFSIMLLFLTSVKYLIY